MLEKLKSFYLLWFEYYRNIPKSHRHTLGQRVDTLLVEAIEGVANAAFLPREEKLPSVRFAVRKVDILKFFFMILWETKSLDTKKYVALSIKLEEIGKMLGGWHGQLKKKNSPQNEEK